MAGSAPSLRIPSPVPNGTFVDSFGNCRKRGTDPCGAKHAGIDIMAPAGSRINAPVTGTVAAAGPSGLGGNRVWVIGSDGLAYYFAHLQTILVHVGDKVNIGDQLGTVGNTGNAAGGPTHLHFSINGKVGAENPVVDPFLVIDKTLGTGAPSTPSTGPVGQLGEMGPGPNGQPVPIHSPADVAALNLDDNVCLLELPVVGCVFRKSNARAWLGALALVGGGVIMAGGIALIAAYGLESNKAKDLLRAASVPGQQRAAAAKQADVDAERDTKAQEREARKATARDRQEAAERRIARRSTGDTSRRTRVGPDDDDYYF